MIAACFGWLTANAPSLQSAGAPRQAPNGTRMAFTGAAADIAADIEAMNRLGVRHLSLTFQGGSLNETLDRMQRFAEDVMPLARR